MKAYWFEPADGVLGYDDGRKPRKGRTHKVKESPVLRARGLHASAHPFDALKYAQSNVLWLVELGGEIVEGQDKCAATERKYIKRVDLTDVLRRFACDCALDVIDKARPYFSDEGWACCTDYLRNPTEEKRAAASDAASDAARDAAWDAAWAAASDAVWAAQRSRFLQMVEAAFSEEV